MTIVDEYLIKANSALQSGDSCLIDAVAREIVAAFSTEIPHLSSYRGSRSMDAPSEHSAADLRKLVGKLCVLRENKDNELYGSYGLGALTDSIRQLEIATSEGYTKEKFAILFKKIDHIYANKYTSYTDGLCGYLYNDDVPDESQAQLRIEKLRIIRDEELRRMRMAETQSTTIAVSQSQEARASATSIAVANLMQTCEKIDEIPSDHLSEEDKDYLKGLLASLEQSATNDKKDKESKARKVLAFLADKGVDAFIAAAPFIWNVLQPTPLPM